MFCLFGNLLEAFKSGRLILEYLSNEIVFIFSLWLVETKYLPLTIVDTNLNGFQCSLTGFIVKEQTPG